MTKKRFRTPPPPSRPRPKSPFVDLLLVQAEGGNEKAIRWLASQPRIVQGAVYRRLRAWRGQVDKAFRSTFMTSIWDWYEQRKDETA